MITNTYTFTTQQLFNLLSETINAAVMVANGQENCSEFLVQDEIQEHIHNCLQAVENARKERISKGRLTWEKLHERRQIIDFNKELHFEQLWDILCGLKHVLISHENVSEFVDYIHDHYNVPVFGGAFAEDGNGQWMYIE